MPTSYTDWVTLDPVVLTETPTPISILTEGEDAFIEIGAATDFSALISAEWNARLAPTGPTTTSQFANVLEVTAGRTVDSGAGGIDGVDDLVLGMNAVKTEMVVGVPGREFVEADYAPFAPAEHLGIEIENAGMPVGWSPAEFTVEDYNFSYDDSSDDTTPLDGAWTYVHSIGAHSVAIPGGGADLDPALVGTAVLSIPAEDVTPSASVTLMSVFGGDFAITLDDSSFPLGAFVRASCRVEVSQVSVTLYPPRARWLLATTASVNVTRQFPRDDALGLGAATRIYPPPRRGRIYPAHQ